MLNHKINIDQIKSTKKTNLKLFRSNIFKHFIFVNYANFDKEFKHTYFKLGIFTIIKYNRFLKPIKYKNSCILL